MSEHKKPCRYSTTKQQREDAWHGRKGGLKDKHRCLEHGGFQYTPDDEKCYRADDVLIRPKGEK
jgi:hypothetical protein